MSTPELRADDIRAEVNALLARLRASAESDGASTASGAQERLQALQAALEATANVTRVADSGRHPGVASLSGTAAAWHRGVERQYSQLSAAGQQLQETVSEARAVLDDAGTLVATRAAADRLVAHSHRLAYGTFAPLLGSHLVSDGPFEPPFPPVYYMQQSRLTRTALDLQERERQEQQATAAAAAAPEATSAAAAPDGAALLPFGLDLPPIPEGWRPGDPIPFPPGLAGELLAATGVPTVAPDAVADADPGAAAAAAQPEAPLLDLDLDTGIDDDFVLNAEAVDAESGSGSDDMDSDSE